MGQARERIFWVFSYSRCTVCTPEFSSPRASSTLARKTRPQSFSAIFPFRWSKRGTPTSASSRAMARLRLGWVMKRSWAALDMFPVRATVRK